MIALTLDNNCTIFHNSYIKLGEQGDAVIVTQFADRDQAICGETLEKNPVEAVVERWVDRGTLTDLEACMKVPLAAATQGPFGVY